MFVPKVGGTLAVFMCFWMDSENYSCTIYWLTSGWYLVQIFIPYWNFEYTKAVTLHCGKNRSWYRPQDPATEVG